MTSAFLAVTMLAPSASAEPLKGSPEAVVAADESAASPDVASPTAFHEESEVRAGWIVAGGITFAVTYAAAALLVVSTESGRSQSERPKDGTDSDIGVYGGPKRTLLIPFVGPFLEMSGTEVNAIGNVIYALDALGQIAGAAMIVGGIAWKTTVRVPNHAVDVRVTPMKLGQGGTGLGLSGAF